MNNIPTTVLAAIDTIAAGLAHQRKKSTPKCGSTCMYRSDDGSSKCAVGWVIPDELYTPSIEGEAADDLFRHERFEDWLETLQGSGNSYELQLTLDSFQNFHDYTSGSLVPLIEGDSGYEALLEIHANDPDEVLAAAIKRELVTRADRIYSELSN